MLENFKEVVEGLEATNESVLSHELNDVLRVLTAFSVVVLPLTLIASIWGMNIHVPGEGTIDGFWIVVGAMVVCWSAWSLSSAGAAGCRTGGRAPRRTAGRRVTKRKGRRRVVGDRGERCCWRSSVSRSR